MRKIILISIFGMLLLSIILVLANEDHESEIEEGRKLVESNISCNELSDEQLEAIGDYLMEQMHPGEAHEMMHEMMGGHDSETTKLMHINMAKGIYCDEDVDMMGCGMMGGEGMMNMKGSMMQGMMQSNMRQGMMGNLDYFGYWNFINILYVILLIGLIILVSLGIIKLRR